MYPGSCCTLLAARVGLAARSGILESLRSKALRVAGLWLNCEGSRGALLGAQVGLAASSKAAFVAVLQTAHEHEFLLKCNQAPVARGSARKSASPLISTAKFSPVSKPTHAKPSNEYFIAIYNSAE